MKPITLILGQDPVKKMLADLRAEGENAREYVDEQIDASLRRVFPDHDPKEIRKQHPETIQRIRDLLIAQMEGRAVFAENLFRHI